MKMCKNEKHTDIDEDSDGRRWMWYVMVEIVDVNRMRLIDK